MLAWFCPGPDLCRSYPEGHTAIKIKILRMSAIKIKILRILQDILELSGQKIISFCPFGLPLSIERNYCI
jgi:hypothetical protein